MKNKTKKQKKTFRQQTRKTRGGEKKTIRYPNGNVYEGDVIMVDGKPIKQGKGTMTYGDENDEPIPERYADTYVGDWLNDKRHGKGKMTYKPSDDSELEYEGDWVDGLKRGKGIMKWGGALDDLYLTYQGDWANNMGKGRGKLTWHNGNVYEGGVDNFPDEDTDDLIIGPDGDGIITYGENEDGFERYDGRWEYGKKQGPGNIHFTDGRIFRGNWENDKPVCQVGLRLEGPWIVRGEYKIWECIRQWDIMLAMEEEDDDDHHLVALEVHQAAAKINLDKYLEVVGSVVPNSPPYPNIRTIKEYTLGKFVPYITERFPQEKDVMIERLTALMNRMNAAVDIVNMPKKKEVVKKTLDFVFQQPPEFIDAYIQTFIKDCYFAYSGAQGEAGMSCIGGIYERFYMLVGDIIYQLCPDENTCEYENKEVYNKLLKIFRKRLTKADVIHDWAIQYLDSVVIKAMSPEERKQHFIEFMRKEYRDMDMLDAHNEAMILSEADQLDERHVFRDLEFGGAGKPTVLSAPPSLKRRSRKRKKTRKNKK